MTRNLTLIASLALALTTMAQDQSYADCLVKTQSRWGAPCEHCFNYTEGYKRDFSGTYQIDLRNSCRDLIEVKVAVQEKNGTWRTFPVRALGPEESFTGCDVPTTPRSCFPAIARSSPPTAANRSGSERAASRWPMSAARCVLHPALLMRNPRGS